MKNKLTVFLLTVLIALSPLSAFAQRGAPSTETMKRLYEASHGCEPWEACHNALQYHREPAGLLGAIGQYGNMMGVWPDGSTVQNPLTHPNKWCHPNDPYCPQFPQGQHPGTGYQQYHQQYPQGQQQFTPQPNHYAPPAQQCGWYTLQGQQQPTWLCQP